MKRFRFPLDRVRHFRKLELETEQAKLEQILAQLRSVERMEEELRRQTAEAANEVRHQERPSATVATGQVATFGAFQGHVSRVARKIAVHKKEVLSRVAEQQKAVLAAQQRFEALERGRERALDRWRDEFALEQESVASELYLARVAREKAKGRRAGS